jgi:hypothetical protein
MSFMKRKSSYSGDTQVKKTLVIGPLMNKIQCHLVIIRVYQRKKGKK